MRRLLQIAMIVVGLPILAQSRLASDFEIAQMRKQLASSRDFLAQLSGRLNLGDLHASRNEVSIARDEYRRALQLAQSQRGTARRHSDLTAYAEATAYAGLAEAKLGRGPAAFELLEESLRYASDSPETWNLYSTAMTLLGKPAKGIAAARNAVAIAEQAFEQKPSATTALDLATYRHALATSFIESGQAAAAERLLRDVIATLQTTAFDSIRREVERSESFEIFSTARGEPAAYLALLNRSQLKLAGLLEKRGDDAGARVLYQRVLDQRTDDATALGALARLSTTGDKDRRFAEAFEANPFSAALIREYRSYLVYTSTASADPSTTGGRMRNALIRMTRGQTTAARSSLDDLLHEFPASATLRALREELDRSAGTPSFLAASPTSVQPRAEELRQLMSLAATDRFTAEQRAALDAMTFRGLAIFGAASPREPGQTVLESGTIEGVPFRFAEPTAFAGVFAARAPYRLSFRFLGVTTVGAAEALLVEPLGLEISR